MIFVVVGEEKAARTEMPGRHGRGFCLEGCGFYRRGNEAVMARVAAAMRAGGEAV
jgi:hypothetical protein